jgi:tetratricopeptide (TPR) repeat protein
MLEADRNARLAREEADRTGEVLEFLVTTLALTDPTVALDPDVTVQKLLDHAAARLAEAFPDQPAAEARLQATIGRAYASLSQHEKAEPHLRRAVELIDLVEGYDPGDFYTTLWMLTNVCFNLDRGDAFAVAQRACEVALDFVGSTSPALADALGRFLGVIQENAWSLEPSSMDAAPGLFKEVVAIADRDLARGDRLWPVVADRFLEAGYTIWYTPHEPLAERFWSQALAIQRRELPPDHPATANTVTLLVGILTKQGRAAEAEELIRDSIEALKRVHQPGAYHLAQAENMLGEVLVAQGLYEDAEPILLESHRSILSTTGDETNFAAVESLMRLIRLYTAWGQPERAQPYRDSLAHTCALGPFATQWEIARSAFGPEAASMVALMDDINTACGGISYRAAEGSRHAPDLDKRVSELARHRAELLSADDPRAATVARLLLGWANALEPADHLEVRRRMAADALVALRSWSDRLPVALAEALAVLAACDHAEGRGEDAQRHALEAWQLLRDSPATGSWFSAAAVVRVARSLLDQGMAREAEVLLRPAYELIRTQLGERHGETEVVRRMLRDLYLSLGRTDEARQFADDPSTP